MNFTNIVVHSVEDMKFRVHLQHEFSLLRLDDFMKVGGVCHGVCISYILQLHLG